MDYFSVFFVNRGYLVCLDISSASSNVQRLQNAIFAETQIRIQDQVLLVHGGQTLEANKPVSEYRGVGTTSNPVYLFDRRFLRLDRDEMSSSQDLKQLNHRIDEAIDQAVRVERGSDATKLFLDLPDRARDCRSAAHAAIAMCARLVQEHTHLNNGWMALVSNMDESVQKMRTRANRFQRNQERVLHLRSKASTLLHDFGMCLEQLKGISIPPSLLSTLGKHTDMSLHDWIQSTDPNFSLQDLVDQVKEQFQKVDDWDSQRVGQELDRVYEQSRNDDYREIKGINTRLNQLDSSLLRSEETEKKINATVTGITQTPSQMDPVTLPALMEEHRRNMRSVYQELRELKKNCDTFFKSKSELLANIRQRLTGWVVVAYERLHTAHTEIVVFEEKFHGLRQRIDLVTQIKEAPVIYATAVTEIIRRTAFQKEFLSWHHIHSEKCSKFSTEEEQVRGDFARKLEKHFLRVLFPGMFDSLPSFFVQTVAKFDETMPVVDANYLRSLRKSVSSLECFLRVSTPQVFTRLGAKDPSLPTAQITSTMRREDSFFTPDHVNNIATLHKTFPSGTWLAGEDTIDNSPRELPAMLARSPPDNFGPSSSSVHFSTAPSLHNLEMDDDDMPSSTPHSLPIQIPSGISSVPHQMSKNSSQFSTPDDHFDSSEQFPIEGCTQRSLTLEQLKPVAAELLKLKEDLEIIKSEMLLSRDQFERELSPVADCARTQILKAVGSERASHEVVVHDLEEQLEVLERSFCRVEEECKCKDSIMEEKQKRIEGLEGSLKEKDDAIKTLVAEQETHKAALVDVRNEVFKQLTIEYELASDDLQREHARLVEEKEEKIRQLNKELERKNSDLEKLRSDPDSDDYRMAVKNEIRQELEKEFKNRIDLITKGLEKKMDENLARHRKDVEYDSRKTVLDLQHNLKWATEERNRLRAELCTDDESRKRTDMVAKEIEVAASHDAKEMHVSSSYGAIDRATLGTQTESGGHQAADAQPALLELPVAELAAHQVVLGERQSNVMLASNVMEASVMPMASSQFFLESAHPSAEDFTRVQSPDNTLEEPSADGNSLSISCQTRILMKNLDLMVTIQDIGEGSTVLVLWDEKHNAFVLFCNSPFIHFVKESSVRRLGLAAPSGVRRNWVLAKVSHVDLCVIRKPDNRYRLPVDARVYRVDVDTVAFDTGYRARSTTT